MEKRSSWEEYFLEIAKEVSKRSTCLRYQGGCLIVKDRRIISTGYNGQPSGTEHCINVGCIREKNRLLDGEMEEYCRGIHAEANAIVQAAKYGVSVEGAVVYSTHKPCFSCVKVLINSGIKEVNFEIDNSSNELYNDVLKQSKIVMKLFPEIV